MRKKLKRNQLLFNGVLLVLASLFITFSKLVPFQELGLVAGAVEEVYVRYHYIQGYEGTYAPVAELEVKVEGNNQPYKIRKINYGESPNVEIENIAKRLRLSRDAKLWTKSNFWNPDYQIVKIDGPGGRNIYDDTVITRLDIISSIVLCLVGLVFIGLSQTAAGNTKWLDMSTKNKETRFSYNIVYGIILLCFGAAMHLAILSETYYTAILCGVLILSYVIAALHFNFWKKQ